MMLFYFELSKIVETQKCKENVFTFYFELKIIKKCLIFNNRELPNKKQKKI